MNIISPKLDSLNRMNGCRRSFSYIILTVLCLLSPENIWALSVETFTVFGIRKVELGSRTSVQAGDVGSNQTIEVGRGSNIQGHVVSNRADIGRDSVIGGDLRFNRSEKGQGTIVEGNEITPLMLPVIDNLPALPSINPGILNVRSKPGTDTLISSGNFNVIEIGRDSRVVFSGGTYNIDQLIIGRHAEVVFNVGSTLNIKTKVEIGRNTTLIGEGGLRASAIVINFQGRKTVEVGRNAIIYAQILAPNATIELGSGGEYRGSFVAEKVEIGENSVLSRENTFSTPPDAAAIVTDVDGTTFPVNEIIILLTDDATRSNAEFIAASVGGTITGFIPSINEYKILVPAQTINQLDALITQLSNSTNPKILAISKNFAAELLSDFPSLNTDLDNLHNRNAGFTLAYDIAKVRQAWKLVKDLNSPISRIVLGIVDSGFDLKHRELLQVDIGSSVATADGHGTAVAGIIGARNLSAVASIPANSPEMNGVLAGVTSNYSLEMVQLCALCLFQSNIRAAVTLAISRNAQIINLSVGGSTILLPELSIANLFWERLFEKNPGILFVAAAGNKDSDVAGAVPAGAKPNTNNVISVAATDWNDKRARWDNSQSCPILVDDSPASNFGSGVDIAAPGSAIYAPWATNIAAPNGNLPVAGQPYVECFGGTSGSAPMVAGVAGLLKALKPDLTPAHIKRILTETANPIRTGEPNKRIGTGCYNTPTDQINTGCRLNALRAVYNLLAYKFRIDNFRIIRNGSLFYEDSFSDGLPPPSAPNFPNGGPASYSVTGTFGPENGGKLNIDSSGALVVGSVTQPDPGDIFLVHRARLQSNIDPNNLTLGLKTDDTFSVTGVFDLIVPDGTVEAYGISLTDRTSTSEGNDDLRLLVRQVTGSAARVYFIRVDPLNDSFFILASTPVDPSHSQIALILSRTTTSNTLIAASFAYVDGGIQGPTTTFAATANIFRSENFTRALFMAESRLP